MKPKGATAVAPSLHCGQCFLPFRQTTLYCWTLVAPHYELSVSQCAGTDLTCKLLYKDKGMLLLSLNHMTSCPREASRCMVVTIAA